MRLPNVRFFEGRCCIDKQSRSELSEAINSMYRWYQKALVCYTYLQDVRAFDDIKTSRWFQRGWTLQELLAPKRVIFVNQDWRFLGRKEDLGHELETFTGIDAAVLRGGSFEEASIAKRMSWAAGRVTLRTEDTAYSPLGIFGINMPLIYGEGENSFIGLQEEILSRNSNDHTIFAWGEHVHLDLSDGRDLVESVQALTLSACDFPMATDLHGLLARSPNDFIHSKDIIISQDSDTFRNPLAKVDPSLLAPSIAGQAIRIGFTEVKTMSYPCRLRHSPIIQKRPATLVWIFCEHEFFQTPMGEELLGRRIYCLLTFPYGPPQRYAPCPMARTPHLLEVRIPTATLSELFSPLFESASQSPSTLQTFDIAPAIQSLYPNSIVLTSFSYRGISDYKTGLRFDPHRAHEMDYRTFADHYRRDLTIHIFESSPKGEITLHMCYDVLVLEGNPWQRETTETNAVGQQIQRLTTEFESEWSLENGTLAKARILARGFAFGEGYIWAVEILLRDP